MDICNFKRRKCYLVVVVFFSFGIFFQWKCTNRFYPSSSSVDVRSMTGAMFYVSETKLKFGKLEADTARCPVPNISMVHENVLPYLEQDVSPLDCSRKRSQNQNTKLRGKSLFTIKDGRYLHKLHNMSITCCMRTIKRLDDDQNLVSNDCLLVTRNITQIPPEMEYILVECSQGSSLFYREPFFVIHNKSNPNSNSFFTKNLLNVVIIGMDATSQLNFHRKMPLSSNFLLRNLSAVLFKGHNKASECTNTNVIPLLTGLHIQNFYRDCVNPQKKFSNHSVHLDNCSFLWNKFEEKGYLTFLGEDFSRDGPLNQFTRRAFKGPPTHYYMRPVVLQSETMGPYEAGEYFCVGNKHGFQVLLDNLKMNLGVNRDKRTFQFVWSCSLGYWNMNYLQRGDQVLLEFLENFKVNYFNNTILFLVADHGNRKKDFRFTRLGAIEDRMPLGTVVLPPWFQNVYSEYYENLRKNSEIMTSHFDMHKTILHLLTLDKKEDDVQENTSLLPGSSLFKPIDKNRGCLQAGINLMWCITCHPRLPLEETVAAEVAQFLVDHLSSYRQFCYPKPMGRHLLTTILSASRKDLRDVHREICSANGTSVAILGFYGQSPLTLNLPCELDVKEIGQFVDIVTVEFATKRIDLTFSGEVLRFRNETEKEWLLHLTEDIQFNWL